MMSAQEFLDDLISPSLGFMGGGYDSASARFLLLCTGAVESDLGRFNKQIGGGPALGPMQVEPDTGADIWINCDALHGPTDVLHFLWMFHSPNFLALGPAETNTLTEELKNCLSLPIYSVIMARLKYSMDPSALPVLTGDFDIDSDSFYQYYKRVYNTSKGATTYEKWMEKLETYKIREVKL